MQQFSGMTILRAYVVKIFDELFSQRIDDEDFKITNNSTIDCETSQQSGLSSTSTEAYISAIVLGWIRFDISWLFLIYLIGVFFVGIVRLFASLLLSKLLRRYHRRSMYFLSAILSILSLLSFATCSLLVNGYHINSVGVIDLKWASLVTACLLVFSVQVSFQINSLLFYLNYFQLFVFSSWVSKHFPTFSLENFSHQTFGLFARV